MISLFDRSFPRVSIERGLGFGSEGLLMGFVNGVVLDALVVLGDGTIMLLPADKVTIFYRYDVETDRWMDISPSEPDQE